MVDVALFGAITLVYLAALLLIGYYGYKRTQCEDDYLVGGRKMNPIVLALSYGATMVSTSAIVGFGGVAANLGMGLVWTIALAVGVGVFIAFVFYGKRTRRLGAKLGAVTFADLLGKRYGSRKVHILTGVIVLIGLPLYAAAILIGGARFIETTFDMDYSIALLAFAIVVAVYVVLGGLIAVMYTDALQGAIMFVGLLILLVFTYYILGGVTHAHEALSDLSTLIPQGLKDQGMSSFTSMPEFGSPIWLTLITTMVLSIGIGVLTQPQLVVRFLAAKDDRSLNRAVLVGGIFVFLVPISAYTVGPLTNVYFYQEQGQLAVDAAGGNLDSVIPLFINSAMPEAFVIIFMLALLAAAMSTLSSQFHTLGTTLGYDIYAVLKGERVKKVSGLRSAQIFTVIMILTTVVIAFLLPPSIIARATAMFMGLCVGTLLPAYTHGIFSKSPSTKAALASMAVGLVTYFTWALFVHSTDATDIGLCHALFGTDFLLAAPYAYINPLVVSVLVSSVTLASVKAVESLMTTKEDVPSEIPEVD